MPKYVILDDDFSESARHENINGAERQVEQQYIQMGLQVKCISVLHDCGYSVTGYMIETEANYNLLRNLKGVTHVIRIDKL